MAKVEGESNKGIIATNSNNYERLLEATRAYFKGKLSLDDYQDFKRQHPLFPPVRRTQKP